MELNTSITGGMGCAEVFDPSYLQRRQLPNLKTHMPSNLALYTASTGAGFGLIAWAIEVIELNIPHSVGWLAMGIGIFLVVFSVLLWIRELGRYYMPLFVLTRWFFRPNLSVYWDVIDDYYKNVSADVKSCWMISRNAYEKFRSMNDDIPKKLDDLIDSAHIPDGLPLPFNENMEHWIKNNRDKWTQHSKELLNFTEQIYQPSDLGGYNLNGTGVIDGVWLGQLDNARRSMTKFYNKAGIMVHDTGEVPARLGRVPIKGIPKKDGM